MELRHLKYFRTVAEELHFGKAAIRLNMSQPPLSLQIRQLENELGVPLFRRTKRNVELTEEGEVFLEKVYQLFTSLDEAIETVKMVNRGEIGEIVIGFIASAAYDILPIIMKHYKQHYPDMHVILKQLTSEKQIKALQEGSLHIGIVSEPIEYEEITHKIIRCEPMVIAIQKEHPLASKSSAVNLIEFANDSFVLTGRKSNPRYYDGVINCCYQAGFSPQIIQETEEMSSVLSLVSAGIGVAVVPASMQLLLATKIVYRDLRNINYRTTTALAWQSDNNSPIIQAFINLVKETVIPIFNR